MRSKASIGSHPIHPMLVVIPLGALPTALVFDVLQVVQGEYPWRMAGLVATLVGVGGIALAAVPGFIDFRASIPRRGAAHAVGRAHLALGLALLGYFTLVALLRWATVSQPSTWAAWATLGASAIGNLGLIAQGFLGGELRSRHRIGVDPALPESLVAPRRGTDAAEEERPAKKGPYSGGGAPGAP